MFSERVRHRGTPAEPYATPNMVGTICRSDSGLRIAPAARGIPACAYVQWGDENPFYTWERLADLQPLGKRKEKPSE